MVATNGRLPKREEAPVYVVDPSEWDPEADAQAGAAAADVDHWNQRMGDGDEDGIELPELMDFVLEERFQDAKPLPPLPGHAAAGKDLPLQGTTDPGTTDA